MLPEIVRREFTEACRMRRTKRDALSAHRRRLRRKGVVRLEVSVRKEYAPLVRGVVKALGDPEREAQASSLLREHFSDATPMGFKALLAAAPLENIDLTRDRDTARDLEM
jgi:hypothetical protein